jgi:hypothetical protein
LTLHDAPREARAAWEVLDYFLRHPDAVDDVVGVARWRLLDERIHRSVAEAQGALEQLVERGFLVAERRASRTIFRLNPERSEEAAEYVRRHQPG